MLYMRCPTCGTVLGDIQKYYEDGLSKICQNAELDSENNNEKYDKEKVDLLNSTKLMRICCRMRLLKYVKLIEIIK
jgi:DNA-directed RNA polymerase subunit N (RpoN/RPB10)